MQKEEIQQLRREIDSMKHAQHTESSDEPETVESSIFPTDNILPTEVTPVYLNNLPVYSSFGKIWMRGAESPDYSYDSNSAPCWENQNRRGYSLGPVMDNDGNEYQYGVHVDGDTKGPFYISFKLNKEYGKLTGYCAYPSQDSVISKKYATAYNKYVEIYGDGELLFKSNEMNYRQSRQRISLDVSGVDLLKIMYPATMGPNEIATLYDLLVE